MNADNEDSVHSSTNDHTGRLRSIFFNQNGLRAGWRIVIFIGLTLPLVYLLQRVTKLFPVLKAAVKINMRGGASVPLGDIVIQGSVLLPLLVVAWVMSKIERRPFAAYGLPVSHAFGKLFWQGAFWGLATEVFPMVLIYAFHGFSFGTVALDAGGIAKYAVLWGIAFVVVGLQEEFFFRGYILQTLSSGVGFWPAAVVMSLLFGAGHLSNPGEGWVGGLNLVFWALVVCFTIRRTGSLWFAVGLHAGDDFAQTFLFSVNNSGTGAQGQLLHSSMHGPAWLTGGAVGPEASVFSFLTIGIFAILFHLLYRHRGPESQRLLVSTGYQSMS